MEAARFETCEGGGRVLRLPIGEIRLSSVTVRTIERQVDRWVLQLNSVIGILCFNLALAAQGTPSPSLNAFLSLLFIALTQFSVYRFTFPSLLRASRALSKYADTPYGREVNRAVVAEWLGGRRFWCSLRIFLLGYLYLVFLIVLPNFGAYSIMGKPLQAYFFTPACASVK